MIENLQELLAQARADGNDALVAAIEHLLSLLPGGGTATPQSGGGNSNNPPPKPGGN